MSTCMCLHCCKSSQGTANVSYSVCGWIGIIIMFNSALPVKGHNEQYIEHIELYMGINS